MVRQIAALPSRHRRRRAAGAVLAVLAATLSACGGTSGGQAGQTTGPVATPAATSAVAGSSISDGCALLTDDEIEQATGFRPISHASGPQQGIFQIGCEWELDNEGGVPWSVVLGAKSPGGRSYYDDYFDPSISDGTPIDGLGDKAQHQDDGSVLAVKGDVMLSILYIEFPSRDEVAVDLMRLALAHL